MELRKCVIKLEIEMIYGHCVDETATPDEQMHRLRFQIEENFCHSNYIRFLQDIDDRLTDSSGSGVCTTCYRSKAEFLRLATPEDEDRFHHDNDQIEIRESKNGELK